MGSNLQRALAVRALSEGWEVKLQGSSSFVWPPRLTAVLGAPGSLGLWMGSVAPPHPEADSVGAWPVCLKNVGWGVLSFHQRSAQVVWAWPCISGLPPTASAQGKQRLSQT